MFYNLWIRRYYLIPVLQAHKYLSIYLQRYGVCCMLILKCLFNRICYLAVLSGAAITLLIASHALATYWTWQFSYVQHLAA